jgi:hypothetical protein
MYGVNNEKVQAVTGKYWFADHGHYEGLEKLPESSSNWRNVSKHQFSCNTEARRHDDRECFRQT